MAQITRRDRYEEYEEYEKSFVTSTSAVTLTPRCPSKKS